MAAVTLTFDLFENRMVVHHGHVTCNLNKESEIWYVWCSCYNRYFFERNSFICKVNTFGQRQNPDLTKNATVTM